MRKRERERETGDGFAYWFDKERVRWRGKSAQSVVNRGKETRVMLGWQNQEPQDWHDIMFAIAMI